MLKVAFLGPESTGKSSLSTQLAEMLDSLFVTEFARDYLSNLGRKYDIFDLDTIALNQYNSINNYDLEKKYSFIDTELITLKIWSSFKYGTCSANILDLLSKQKIDIYFLCKPDFPWEFDVLRENPNDRDLLFELYEKELKDLKYTYFILEGSIENRLKSVRAILNSL